MKFARSVATTACSTTQSMEANIVLMFAMRSNGLHFEISASELRSQAINSYSPISAGQDLGPGGQTIGCPALSATRQVEYKAW